MSTGDDSRGDREKIAELNEIHTRLRWWSDDEIVALIAEDRDLATAVWRDAEARRTLLEALVELDPAVADKLQAQMGDERWAERGSFGALLRRSFDQLSRRRR